MGIRRLAAALVLLASGLAGAQPAAQTDKLRQQAGELVKKAIAKSQAGDHESAIDLYGQAYILVPTPILLSNIASEYQSSNKPVQALKYFCDYLKAEPTGANVTYATAQAKTLQIQLGHTPVDDSDVCKPPEPPKLVEPPKPEPTVTATTTPITEPSAPQPGRTFEIAGLAVGGAGVLAFGVGVYYGLQAKSISDDISSHSTMMAWRNDIVAYEQEGQDDQTKQIIFMTAGGVIAAGGVVLYVLGHSKNTAAEPVTLRPLASPTSVGLALGGGF
jgi:hypothetical protein